MKKETLINETLNQLLLKVMSGTDYVSKIAKETKKSIPVVYRQLDSLVNIGLLIKKRAGKKVSYVVNWTVLSATIAATVLLDLKQLKKTMNATAKLRSIKDFQKVYKTLPIEKLETNVEKITKAFFTEPQVVTIFKKYLHNIDVGTTRASFRENMEAFLDMFGMMTEKKQIELLGKEVIKRNKLFLDYCKARYLHKQAKDPRSEFIN